MKKIYLIFSFIALLSMTNVTAEDVWEEDEYTLVIVTEDLWQVKWGDVYDFIEEDLNEELAKNHSLLVAFYKSSEWVSAEKYTMALFLLDMIIS